MDEEKTTKPNPLRIVNDQTPSGEAATLLLMIERAARDPNVDIDKMERLFQMKERAEAIVARRAFDAAFSVMQTEMPEIDKKGKIIIKEKGGEKIIQTTPYALWDDTNRLIKPILAKHGFGLSFRIHQTQDRIITKAVLSHNDGHREETEFAAPIDSTGSKNNVQGWGSSFSYGKRYTGTAILNITTRGEDDDGQKAGADACIDDDQRKILAMKMEEVGQDSKRFLAYFKIAGLDQLKAKDFDRAMSGLNAKASQ